MSSNMTQPTHVCLTTPCTFCLQTKLTQAEAALADLREKGKALGLLLDALDDWMRTYAPEECTPESVRESKNRIFDKGGTLAYITDLRLLLQSFLAALNAKGGKDGQKVE